MLAGESTAQLQPLLEAAETNLLDLIQHIFSPALDRTGPSKGQFILSLFLRKPFKRWLH